MTRMTFRRLKTSEAETIVDLLSERQYVRPHAPIGDALRHVRNSLGLDAGSTERSLEWLKLDPSVAIGRLRRSELSQLARCIRRFQRHARTRASSTPCDTKPLLATT